MSTKTDNYPMLTALPDPVDFEKIERRDRVRVEQTHGPLAFQFSNAITGAEFPVESIFGASAETDELMTLPPYVQDVMSEVEGARALEATERRAESIPARHWHEVSVRVGGVTLDPWVHSGQPVVVGTRIPLSVVVGYLFGPGKDQLLSDYPDLAGSEKEIEDAADFIVRLLGG